MTRFGRTVPRGQFDLAQAFRFLGRGPSRRELGQAVELLHAAGVDDVAYDQDLQDLAIESGSSALVALDLHSAVAFGVEVLWRGPTRVEDHARS